MEIFCRTRRARVTRRVGSLALFRRFSTAALTIWGRRTCFPYAVINAGLIITKSREPPCGVVAATARLRSSS